MEKELKINPRHQCNSLFHVIFRVIQRRGRCCDRQTFRKATLPPSLHPSITGSRAGSTGHQKCSFPNMTAPSARRWNLTNINQTNLGIWNLRRLISTNRVRYKTLHLQSSPPTRSYILSKVGVLRGGLGPVGVMMFAAVRSERPPCTFLTAESRESNPASWIPSPVIKITEPRPFNESQLRTQKWVISVHVFVSFSLWYQDFN